MGRRKRDNERQPSPPMCGFFILEDAMSEYLNNADLRAVTGYAQTGKAVAAGQARGFERHSGVGRVLPQASSVRLV